MRIVKLDAIIICTGPILMSYMFFVPGVSLAEALMLLGLSFHLLSGDFGRSRRLALLLAVFALLFMHLLYIGVVGVNENLGYFRLVKFFILISFIALAYQNLDRNVLVDCLVTVLCLNFFAVLCQYLIYFTAGRAVPFVVPFLPLVNSDIDLESITRVLTSDFRPGGFFMEPAHLSYYMFFSGLFLYQSCFKRKNTILTLICITLFSTFSSFGFMAGLLLLALLVWKSGMHTRLFALFVVLTIIPFTLDTLENILTQLPQIARLIDPEGVAITGRLFAGEGLVERLDESFKLFGLGFGNFKMDGMVNGIAYFRLSFGDTGIFLIASVLAVYLTANIKKLPYIFMFIVMSFFTSMLLTPFLLVASLPLLARQKNEGN